MTDWLEREEPFLPSSRREHPFLPRTLRALRDLTEPEGPRGPLERIHPRAKLLATLGLLAGVALTRRTELLLLPGAWTGLHLALLPPARRRRALALGGAALVFSLLVLAPLPFLGQTGTLLRLLAKTAVTVPLAAALGLSSERHGLLRELRVLGLPRDLIFALDQTLRALHLLAREGASLLEALLLRRLAPSRSWGPLGGWAGVLFLKTLEMEHRTREARICRGGDGPPPLRPAPWEPWDWLYLSGALALLALLARGTP